MALQNFHSKQLVTEISGIEALTAIDIESKSCNKPRSLFSCSSYHVLAHMENMGDRLIDNVDNAEKQQHLDNRWQTGTHRIIAFLSVKFLGFLLEQRRIAGVAFLQLENLRLYKPHSRRALLRFVADREKQQLCHQRENNYSPGVVRDDHINEPHKVSEWQTDNIIQCVQFSIPLFEGGKKNSFLSFCCLRTCFHRTLHGSFPQI